MLGNAIEGSQSRELVMKMLEKLQGQTGEGKRIQRTVTAGSRSLPKAGEMGESGVHES